MFNLIDLLGSAIKDKEKDSRHIHRSSKRISSMGTTVKSVCFGCVVRRPWVEVPCTDSKNNTDASFNSSQLLGIESRRKLRLEPQGMLTSTTESGVEAAMVTLYTGTLDEVKY